MIHQILNPDVAKTSAGCACASHVHHLFTMADVEPSYAACGSSSRKRSRTTVSSSAPYSASSIPRTGGGTIGATGTSSFLVPQPVPRPESSDDRVRASQLHDPKQRTKALNAILKLSSSHEMNYALTGDSVLQRLVNIAMECMHWENDTPPSLPSRQQHRNKDQSKPGEPTKTSNLNSDSVNLVPNDMSDGEEGIEEDPIFSSAMAWTHPPTSEMENWANHWKNVLSSSRRCLHSNPQDPNNNFKTLEVIVAILRNLSFVGANLRMLAYTPSVISVLIGCMYECHEDFGSAGAASTTDYRGSSSRDSGQYSSGHSTSASEEAAKAALGRINLTVNAMQTLIHLIPYLDFSGQKLLADRLFYSPHSIKEGPMVPDSSSFGQTASGSWGFGGMWLAKRLDTKEDVMSDVTKDFLLTFASDYLVAIWSLFPALAHVLTNPHCPRSVMLVAVDLLQELISQARVGVVGSVDLEDQEDEIPTLRAILVRMPDAVLDRLVDLLYVPRLGPDSLEYLDPVHNIVTRVTTLKLLMGYDATVDTDLRDRTLDVLVPLLELDSPRMASRLGMHTYSDMKRKDSKPLLPMVRTRLWDALVPILTSKVGRNEATLLASHLFRELAKARSNQMALQYVQGRLVELASRDNRVANLLWNHLRPISSHGSTDDDHDDDNIDETESADPQHDNAHKSFVATSGDQESQTEKV